MFITVNFNIIFRLIYCKTALLKMKKQKPIETKNFDGFFMLRRFFL